MKKFSITKNQFLIFLAILLPFAFLAFRNLVFDVTSYIVEDWWQIENRSLLFHVYLWSYIQFIPSIIALLLTDYTRKIKLIALAILILVAPIVWANIEVIANCLLFNRCL